MVTLELKQKIKDYFIEVKEDKFTKVKSIQCKYKIEWKGKELENKFMLTNDSNSNSLSMSIDYRHKDNVDSVFFGFTYSNTNGGYPGMTNIKMYLILDDDKTIELSDSSGFDHLSQSNKFMDNYITQYIETAQLAVSMSDFIAIANASKIEYSIRFGQGSLENIFSKNDLLIFKGFYNSSFDDEFEIDHIFNSVKGKLSATGYDLSVFQKFINNVGFECIKTEIDIEQFRFSRHQNSPIQLEESENIVMAVYSNSMAKSACDLLITNKRLFFFNYNFAKLKTIALIGKLNFEIGKNILGVEKLIEKNSSFSMIITIDGMAKEIANILNSVVKNNNDL